MRYAIYFTPGPEHQLTRAAGLWLGRDVIGGRDHAPPEHGLLTAQEHAQLTAEPRRYGFHATMVAPFRLAAGASAQDLTQTLMSFSAGRISFDIPRLEISRIGAFYALVPARETPPLAQLAGDAVRAFAPYRAPLNAAEIERRRPDRLTPNQQANLRNWGYPYVFEEFRFHMTLTGPTQHHDRGRIEQALHQWFDPVPDGKVAVEALALFTERASRAPFDIHMTAPFKGV